MVHKEIGSHLFQLYHKKKPKQTENSQLFLDHQRTEVTAQANLPKQFKANVQIQRIITYLNRNPTAEISLRSNVLKSKM